MTSDRFEYEAIGVIRTPFDSPEGMPIQSVGNDATEGIVEVDEAYEDGLKDLNGFTHCILLYHFHKSSSRSSLHVEPFLDEEKRGVFATRAPQRPNRIGISIVEIDTIVRPKVVVDGIDVVDGTPLLDIKPFVPEFDVPDSANTGWLDASMSAVRSKQADGRFR
ncbi:tRNA (N6-threonylcarbamoyladenosine(37)-N6)-methyltransferase TrmO [Halorientalis marina]|uniref:tRNA (N6-threonylcarbamoyladenosine(37)-N6)-methyltransferase TrmO n=1 Tax=Halorientalis marina TaxID=2931976 RepID=UPI001FF18B49|nr:tRNA (N6-threonylcarbamoyladenosine(37)-N6)-methyltransferase TrmO [Halorientalis marina]